MPNSLAFFWTPRSTGWVGNRLSSSQRPTASLKLAKGGFAVLTHLLGPLLALFPRRWRKLLPAGSAVEWRRATVLSGFGEAVIAFIALMYWYSYYMAVMADHGLDAAPNGKLPCGVTDHAICFAVLLLLAPYPST